MPVSAPSGLLSLALGFAGFARALRDQLQSYHYTMPIYVALSACAALLLVVWSIAAARTKLARSRVDSSDPSLPLTSEVYTLAVYFPAPMTMMLLSEVFQDVLPFLRFSLLGVGFGLHCVLLLVFLSRAGWLLFPLNSSSSSVLTTGTVQDDAVPLCRRASRIRFISRGMFSPLYFVPPVGICVGCTVVEGLGQDVLDVSAPKADYSAYWPHLCSKVILLELPTVPFTGCPWCDVVGAWVFRAVASTRAALPVAPSAYG